MTRDFEKFSKKIMEAEENGGTLVCRFSTHGCIARFGHRLKRKNHERTCDFRPLPCPLGGASCGWEGESNQISSHVEEKHAESVFSVSPFSVGGGFAFFFKMTIITNDGGAADGNGWGRREGGVFVGNRWRGGGGSPYVDFEDTIVSLGRCFDQVFYLHLRPPPRPSFLRMSGTRRRSRGFVYKLELRRNHRRIIWEAKPVSAFERVKAVDDGEVVDEDDADLDSEEPFAPSVGGADDADDADEDVENLIWLESKTLSSFADEDGMINVRMFLEVESNFQRSGWFRFEKCDKCAQWDAIDTDYVFLKSNGVQTARVKMFTEPVLRSASRQY